MFFLICMLGLAFFLNTSNQCCPTDSGCDGAGFASSRSSLEYKMVELEIENEKLKRTVGDIKEEVEQLKANETYQKNMLILGCFAIAVGGITLFTFGTSHH